MRGELVNWRRRKMVVVVLFTCALFVLFVGQLKLFYEGDIVVLSFDARRVGVDDLSIGIRTI